MKKIITVILALMVAIGMVSCSKKDDVELTEIDYSENVESITHYFDAFDMIEKVYFKSNNTDDGGAVGPSNFRIVGFVCLAEEEKTELCESYEFVEAEPLFPEGISPAVTGYSEFKWTSCAEYTREV